MPALDPRYAGPFSAGVEVRYDIRMDERGHWIETGDRSTDGEKTWTRFIELDLERISEPPAEPGR